MDFYEHFYCRKRYGWKCIGKLTSWGMPAEHLNKNLDKVDRSKSLFKTYDKLNQQSTIYRSRGMRYTENELDIAAYEYMTGGNCNYQFKKANMVLPSVKTVKRHIAQHTSDTQEGKLMIKPLLKYLKANDYPLVVALSEDGTTLSPNPEFDPRTDSTRGLVAPLNEFGMPTQEIFKATSAVKMIDDIEKFPIGEYLYVVMATPMVVGASPYCIFYMCSDNKFTHTDVIKRWNYIEKELQLVGVTVVAHASDGDPRLLKAMRERTCIPSAIHSTLYGDYFVVNTDEEPVCMQDIIHLVNKLRHALLDPKKQMRLGNILVVLQILLDHRYSYPTSYEHSFDSRVIDK